VQSCNEESFGVLRNFETLEHVYLIVEKLFGPKHVRRFGGLTMRVT
jgi:hypothetical protein